MKKTFYFTHDFNARNDEKILRLRIKYGMLGYGVYFALIERLGEATDYVSVADYNSIAYDLRVDASVIKSVINDFGLFAFTGDGECFYSESLIARMKPLEALHEQRRIAGIKSAEKRWKKSSVENDNGEKPTGLVPTGLVPTEVELPPNGRITTVKENGNGRYENGEKPTDSEHPDNQRLHNDRITTVKENGNGRYQNFQQKEIIKENKENNNPPPPPFGGSAGKKNSFDFSLIPASPPAEALPKGYESFVFDFVDSHLRQPFYDWLEYKGKRREKYKTQKTLEMCYDRLKEFSGNDPATAGQIVRQSMANNWAGIFGLKNSDTKAGGKSTPSAGERKRKLLEKLNGK
jgi:hypothetical protein